MINYSISKIVEMVDNKKFSLEMLPFIETLLLAINDWPYPLENLYDYNIEVQKFIKNKSTKKHIEFALKNIDFSKFAWEAESLSYLIELYDHFDPSFSLKDIIDNMMADVCFK